MPKKEDVVSSRLVRPANSTKALCIGIAFFVAYIGSIETLALTSTAIGFVPDTGFSN
jgi:hypothetical protein